MNRMQEWLARAATELGLRVQIPHIVKLSHGDTLTAEALFPELGNQKGMLVFSSADKLDTNARRDLLAQGFGISSFSEPLKNEVFDIAHYAEMFAEWGWGADPEKRPGWME
jgi:hypothetical protein